MRKKYYILPSVISNRGEPSAGGNSRRKEVRPMLQILVCVAIAAAIAVKWYKDIKKAVEAAKDSRDGKEQEP
jgi:hypothetical protein